MTHDPPAPIHADLLIEARWIAPVRPRAALLSDHAVAVRNGRIVALMPRSEAAARVRATGRVSLDRHLLTPGWVNAHTHASMALLRGVGDDLPLMQWLTQRIWPLEGALVDADFVYDGTRLAALEMLRAGTTCASDMYFHPDAAARAMRDVGLRAAVGIIAIEMPTRYAASADEYLRKGLAARDALRDDALVHFTLAPHAPYTVSDATLSRVAMLAEELDLQVHTHLHETAHEIAESARQFGRRPMARLDSLGLLNERLIAVHAVHLEPTEIALLAARGSSVVHCPASNLKLASGLAPIAALLDAGVNVALGTDGAASNNRLDLMAEARLAALLAKGASGRPDALPAWQALEAATLGGARALGLEREIGSIEPGKSADLVAFDFDAPELQPCFDPISHLVYAASREHASDVWVAGAPVVRTRQLTSSGRGMAEAIGACAHGWQARVTQALGRPGPAAPAP